MRVRAQSKGERPRKPETQPALERLGSHEPKATVAKKTRKRTAAIPASNAETSLIKPALLTAGLMPHSPRRESIPTFSRKRPRGQAPRCHSSRRGGGRRFGGVNALYVSRARARVSRRCRERRSPRTALPSTKSTRTGLGGRPLATGRRGVPVITFKRSTRLYNVAMSYNKGLDRDKDGIACETR